MDSKTKKVSYQDGQNFARKNKIDVSYEASAKTGEGINLLFD